MCPKMDIYQTADGEGTSQNNSDKEGIKERWKANPDDDLGVAAEEQTRNWVYDVLRSRFGEMKREKLDFTRVGHQYAQAPRAFEVNSDHGELVASPRENPLPSKDLTKPLDPGGLTLLRGNNGCPSHATSGNPELVADVRLASKTS